MDYYPDNWVVLKITDHDYYVYKVLGGWSGGYATGDSWRMNSGIVKVEETDEHYLFHGTSGSVYHCLKSCNMLKMNNAHVYNQLKERYGDMIELLPEETNYMELL